MLAWGETCQGTPSPHVPLAHSPPLCTDSSSLPAEMDFAKGLQKIVHNCRQSVMQEVGPRACN